MPKGKVAWRDVWPGAAIAATGIALSKLAFSAYFAYANVAAAYGAAGSLVVLLLWIYYTSQIFFFGLEVTYTYAKEFGSLKGQNPGDLKYS
jgi:membrane protein